MMIVLLAVGHVTAVVKDIETPDYATAAALVKLMMKPTTVL